MLIITDIAVSQMVQAIAAHEPERGGALLGPPNCRMVSEFMSDSDAQVSRASYLPTQDLADRVQNRERDQGLEFKGIVHSHPGSYDLPSGPDRYAFRRGLELNPHMACFIAPIITLDRPANPKVDNEVDMGLAARMTVYAAYRPTAHQTTVNSMMQQNRGDDIESQRRFWSLARDSQHAIHVESLPCVIMPVGKHVDELTPGFRDAVKDDFSTAWGTFQVNGIHFLSAALKSHQYELIILFPPSYPMTKPAALLTHLSPTTSLTEEIAMDWPIGTSSLWKACERGLRNAIGASPSCHSIETSGSDWSEFCN